MISEKLIPDARHRKVVQDAADAVAKDINFLVRQVVQKRCEQAMMALYEAMLERKGALKE